MKDYISISKLAKLSRTTRDTLLHYDKIGLVKPIVRDDETGYRGYSEVQVGAINIIRLLKKSGYTLKKLKELRARPSPALALKIIADRGAYVERRIDELTKYKRLLCNLKRTIEGTVNIEDESRVEFLDRAEERIILGDENDFSGGKNDYDALHIFFDTLSQKYDDVDLDYFAWGYFDKERILRGDYTYPSRYFLNNPAGRDIKAAGLYAVGYARGYYGQTAELYKRVVAAIGENGYEISGPAYESYPQNELCVADPNNYLIRLEIAVSKKV
ncbi:MAG: MerR family transcriptional regulator [Clostridiales bacterium]|jgi:DNA-binding transcriptional MerR regulator/effector-binding domain-containing protein|nr:MerR family transcriptional regulator [Clostridiales bacterium]